MLVFRKELFVEDVGFGAYLYSKEWVDACDRCEVINDKCKVPGHTLLYSIH